MKNQTKTTVKRTHKPNEKPLTLKPLNFSQAIKKAVNTKIETKTIKNRKNQKS